ncbi:hypothetical protein M378DRAFT_172770 [Amanita muscaria Koide BX008]|uniref:Uncharacterized protein n=1 Tax=Amanita muscaria (strain Koide BX008) TaxID=946122 RepID=A0A0C2WIA1_AMAMK|nr:hypothetical protein M378DRAFT_172770 [Amanita muscaria Koide BX008]
MQIHLFHLAALAISSDTESYASPQSRVLWTLAKNNQREVRLLSSKNLLESAVTPPKDRRYSVSSSKRRC